MERLWYRFATTLQRLDPVARSKVYPSKNTRTALTRIAQLPRVIGDELDELRAPLRCYQFIAYAPDRLEAPRNVAQDARRRAVLAFQAERQRWPRPRELSILALKIDERITGRAAPAPAAAPSDEAQAQPTREDAVAVAESLARMVAEKHPDLAGHLKAFALRGGR